MKVDLKGLHRVATRLASGEIATYFYAWRGGPRIDAAHGSPEFHAAFAAAHRARKKPVAGTVFSLIAAYKASSEFTTKAEKTKSDYLRYLKMIEGEFGDMPIAALSEPATRGEFKSWRDKMAGTPRTADYAWTMVARVFSVAKDRGLIAVNPCERGGRLYEADRADKIWTADDISAFVAVAPVDLQAAMLLALWTGQRQSDLLRLTWSAYDGAHIRLRQGKHGARVVIPVGGPLKIALDAAKRERADALKNNRSRISTLTILTNSRGRPWTGSGFRSSWDTAFKLAELGDLHFHDLRGTAVTRLALAGCTVPEIASFTGHSLEDVQYILDAHYLGGRLQLAESAITKLNAKFA